MLALALLVMSTELWLPLGISVASAIACGSNCLNVTNTPTAVATLNGTDQTVSNTLTLSVNTTLSLGWNVTITSTQFTTGTTPRHSLSTTASSVTGVTDVCATGYLCLTMPHNSVTYPVAVPAGNSVPTAVKFYNAQALMGLGTFDLSATINVKVPANTYAGTYSSTITLAYVSGP
jgi:hypothetical protein